MAGVIDLQASVNAMGVAINAQLAKIRPASVHADNATSFFGSSANDFVLGALGVISPHIGDMGNPHGLTAAQANTWEKFQVDALVKNLFAAGIIPFTSIGVQSSNDSNEVRIRNTVQGNGVLYTVEAGTFVVLNGRFYTMPALVGTLTPFNSTQYAYIVVTSTGPQYRITSELLAESESTVYLATLANYSNSGSTANVKMIRLENYRPSQYPIGSAYPVTVGTAGQPASLLW